MPRQCFAIGCYILDCSDHSTAVADSRHCFDRNTATDLVDSSAVDYGRSTASCDHIAVDSCFHRSTIGSNLSIDVSHNTVSFTEFDQKRRSFSGCHPSCSLSSSNLHLPVDYTTDITGVVAMLVVGLPSGKPTGQTVPLSRRAVAVRQPLSSSVCSRRHHRSHEG